MVMATYRIDVTHTTVFIKKSLPHWVEERVDTIFLDGVLVQVSSFKNGTSILRN